jgi:hypothetical protein
MPMKVIQRRPREFLMFLALGSYLKHPSGLIDLIG